MTVRILPGDWSTLIGRAFDDGDGLVHCVSDAFGETGSDNVRGWFRLECSQLTKLAGFVARAEIEKKLTERPVNCFGCIARMK